MKDKQDIIYALLDPSILCFILPRRNIRIQEYFQDIKNMRKKFIERGHKLYVSSTFIDFLESISKEPDERRVAIILYLLAYFSPSKKWLSMVEKYLREGKLQALSSTILNGIDIVKGFEKWPPSLIKKEIEEYSIERIAENYYNKTKEWSSDPQIKDLLAFRMEDIVETIKKIYEAIEDYVKQKKEKLSKIFEGDLENKYGSMVKKYVNKILKEQIIFMSLQGSKHAVIARVKKPIIYKTIKKIKK